MKPHCILAVIIVGLALFQTMKEAEAGGDAVDSMYYETISQHVIDDHWSVVQLHADRARDVLIIQKHDQRIALFAAGYFVLDPLDLGIGADLNANGIPDLIVADNTGGSVGLSSFAVYELGEEISLIQEFTEWGSMPYSTQDVPDVPGIELIGSEWNSGFVDGRQPEALGRWFRPKVIYAWNDEYQMFEIEPALMRTERLSDETLSLEVDAWRERDPRSFNDYRGHWDIDLTLWERLFALTYAGHLDQARKLVALTFVEDQRAALAIEQELFCLLSTFHHWPVIAAMNGVNPDLIIWDCATEPDFAPPEA